MGKYENDRFTTDDKSVGHPSFIQISSSSSKNVTYVCTSQ